MKSSTVLSRSPRAKPTLGQVESDRDQWPMWVNTLRRYQLDSLVGWFLDVGRPFAFLSAQIMYFATPFVGRSAERVGRLLESDEDSRDFSRLLAGDPSAGGQQKRDSRA